MEILTYTAFSTDPAGGNPAGVVLDASGLDDAAMLAAAARVGFSETAFVLPGEDGQLDVRYFSPLAEVPFCGHATIALAVAWAHRYGVGGLRLRTKAGPVAVATAGADDGTVAATLVSVPPRTRPLAGPELAELLAALRWSADDLDPALPPRVAYAGAWHPVIAAAGRERLAALDYDLPALAELMRRADWTTIDLVWRESETVFHARNPFPPGGVVEDPATGAAAAAFGGYLRELGLVATPAELTVFQGQDLGRPSTIGVGVPTEPGSGISVTGVAVPLPPGRLAGGAS
ncbi:PhzF family phenazine biosynthesis protein [Streptacidiphilus sp. P02-A3a]|uniref:PhzF family phenazine biosynthesis protein n=1 Tax=Streptacidiphilus sp. P02-A3a TaxID=2704468 RepID=UPI0015F7B2F5|nr:PhzF family phenazine biosynthesis isomerase [Streptacidiphilus sp. P02-A3a]QMU71014.1 PhzF family phenazine biosynthesis protein [Streptacidiphilus sp. P02-A3a]